MRPVVVHGGGPQISELMERLGKKPEFVDGLRVTDAETVDIARMVLKGQVNPQLVAAINVHGRLRRRHQRRRCRTDPSHGTRSRARLRRRRHRDQPEVIHGLIDDEFIPVIATIGSDETGQAYNINADTVAGAIAEALGAEKLVYLTDIEGLRRDVADAASLIRQVTADELDQLVVDGMIAGGMIPKVASCTHAVRNGVHRAHILDGRIAHVLLLEIFTDAGIGTMIMSERIMTERIMHDDEDDSDERPRLRSRADGELSLHAGVRPAGDHVRARPRDRAVGLGRQALPRLPRRHRRRVARALQPAVAEAVGDQLDKLLHVSNFFANPVATEAAVKINDLLLEATGHRGQIFFTNSGAESNECAIKLARKHGGRGRHTVVSALGSFHGRTLATLAATGQPAKHEPFAPMPEGFRHVAWGDLDAMRQAVDGSVAAVLIEPIQGEGGVHPATTEYLAGHSSDLRRDRRADDGRRDPDRLRTHRAVVRLRARRREP